MAEVFGLPVDKARWLLATIAFYCIAGADTIYAIADDDEGQVITEFKQGMRALVIGSLQLLDADDGDGLPDPIHAWRGSTMRPCLPRPLDDLRRYAVRAPCSPTTLLTAIRRLGFVQADPIRHRRAQDPTPRHG